MRTHVEATWGHWKASTVRAEMARLAASGKAHSIEVDGGRVGAMVCNCSADPLVIEQLYVAPNFQRRGIGSRCVDLVLSRAKRTGVRVKLEVLKVNPAKAFYERQGFRQMGETQFHYRLEWCAS